MKPEALISGNIWGLVLRMLLLSLESACDYHTSSNDRLEICYPESIHKMLNISSKSTPIMEPSSLLNIEMEFSTKTRKDCLIQLSFATLPLIYNIEASPEEENYCNVRYYKGLSLAEVEIMIKPANDNNDEKMIASRLYPRSVFILDIVMAIYKAFESGIVFTDFGIEEFTFRAGHFCIKTYRAAQPSTDFEALKKSVSNFANSYYGFYLMDSIFIEGKSEYRLLHQIESLVLRRIPEHLDTFRFSWERLFSQLIVKFEGIFKQLNISFEDNRTMYLLKTTSRSFPSSVPSSSSVSSSVETMAIPDQSERT